MRYGLLWLLLLVVPAFAANTMPSPIGYWKTIDDVTGKPKSIIHITETNQHKLVGSIVQIYPQPGQDQHELCAACEGEKHNQPIVGMTILEGLQYADGQWEGGTILDPHNGKTYHCAIRVYENNKKLLIRGYIGIPLLGRSQEWLRVSS